MTSEDIDEITGRHHDLICPANFRLQGGMGMTTILEHEVRECARVNATGRQPDVAAPSHRPGHITLYAGYPKQ